MPIPGAVGYRPIPRTPSTGATARSETADTKSWAGRRPIGLPPALLDLLRAHRREQDRERETAAQLWQEGGFTTPTGRLISPGTDYHQWKRLFAAARLRDGRLHDARHMAATVLLILGVPERAVMGLMGWSSTGMAARYQPITGTIRDDVAERIGGLIWGPPEGTGTGTGTERQRPDVRASGRPGVCAGSAGGGCGIRTREGVNPTRFPSVRHRPLGESSASKHSRAVRGAAHPPAPQHMA
jgi:integrase-like protein